MLSKIFVNLPVASLDQSVGFFKALGFSFNAQFTDDTATCMVVSEDISVMLLTHPKFAQFTTKPISDASKATEVLLCLACESREEVDALVKKALAAGGTTPKPAQDHGFMYGHGFTDLDGHIWELIWMDTSALPATTA